MADTTQAEIEAELRAAGVQSDASQDADSGSYPGTAEIPQPPSTPNISQDAPASVPRGGATPPAATTADPAAAKTPAAPKSTPADPGASEASASSKPGPATPYEQARRDKREREARAWQKIEEEKAALKAEREQLETHRRQAQTSAPPADQPVRDAHGYSAEDYERASRKFAEEGDDSLARSAQAQAAQLRDAEGQRQLQAFGQEIQRGIAQILEKRPEFKDPQSEAGQAVSGVLREFPLLRRVPGGFGLAVQLLDARKSATAIPGLQARFDALTKENQRLTQLTSLPASNPRNASGKEKSLSDLPLKDQEKTLRRLASDYDES